MPFRGNDRSMALRMLGTVLVSGGLAGLLLALPLGRDASAPPVDPPREPETPVRAAPSEPPGAIGGIQIISPDSGEPSPAANGETVPSTRLPEADALTNSLVEPDQGPDEGSDIMGSEGTENDENATDGEDAPDESE